MLKSVLLFLLLAPLLVTATDYYVARDGNDANDGSINRPFLTISKAAGLMVAGDLCYLREGTYREILSPANGGTADLPITFRAWGEETVVISATEPVRNWTGGEEGTYKASVNMDLNRQTMLYYNGEPMDYARWPNNEDGDPFTIDAMAVAGGTASSIVADNLPAGLDLSESYVWYLGAHSGSSWTQPISNIDGNTINHTANDITLWPFPPHNPTVLRNGNRGQFYVFGAKDLLDFPKEWYFDKTNNEVFFSPPGGAPPNSTTEYAARTHTILINQPWIVVENIGTFGGIVEIKGNNTTLQNCEVLHGLQALDEMGNTDAQVNEGSVWVRASNVLIEDNLIAGGSLSGISVQGWGGVSEASIIGNEVLDFNTVGNHSSPIRCRAPQSIIISNTIIGGGRDGIFMPSEDSEVAWNDVSDMMRINNDGGLFYVVGNDSDKNTSIHHNWFHDSFGPAYADGRCAGIYLDNDSKGYDVHHNVVWNISWSAVQMNWDAWNNDIFNNTFWNVQQAMGIWLNGRTQVNNRIWNNYSSSGPWEGQDVANNFIDATDPFVDLEEQDFRPADNSPLINAGRIIPGITDGYIGSAPEIGAYEANRPVWIPGAPRAGGGNPLLPVELTALSASAVKSNVMVKWETASESFNEGFEVQHSIDGATFSAIGVVAGAGNTSEYSNYGFEHVNAPADLNYYRLKQIDYAGTFSYSNVVTAVVADGHERMAIYPNPASSELFITTVGSGQVEVRNARGQLINKLSVTGEQQRLDISHLTSGLYFVTLRDGDNTSTQRFMKK